MAGERPEYSLKQATAPGATLDCSSIVPRLVLDWCSIGARLFPVLFPWLPGEKLDGVWGLIAPAPYRVRRQFDACYTLLVS
jgi:hypothetical protein